MPQMAPINWLILFIFFILCFFIFNTINYFNYSPMIKTKEKKMFLSNKLNWKW